MTITLGLTESDVKNIECVKNVLCASPLEDKDIDQMTDQEINDNKIWFDMRRTMMKIFYSIENQMEIDKSATGRTHAFDCQSKRCNDKDVFLREKLITILEEVGVPRNIMIDTGQNYAAVTDVETMTADKKCFGDAGSLERHLSSIKKQEINDRNNIYHSGKSSG